MLREKAGRRRLARGRTADGAALFLKHFTARGSHWKRRARLTPAAREFRALASLHDAGVAVPEPLALAESTSGDEILVLRFLDGEPLARALDAPAPRRRALLADVGDLVRRMHAAGRVHRDLHRENVWVTPSGPVLIDLQQSLPVAPSWLRRRDMGELDASLSPLLSLTDRIRLRAAMQDVRRPFGEGARAALRRVGAVSEARVQSHARSRTRRSLIAGRRFARLSCELGVGMRLRRLSEEEARRRLADAPRCPDARAGWVAGHGLRARGIGAPLPLAFVASKRESRLLLEDGAAADPGIELAELVALGVALRRHQVAVGANPVLGRDAEGRLGPLPLEQVSFPDRLPREAARRTDAWIADAIERHAPDAEARRRAWSELSLRLRLYGLETVTQRK